MTALGGYDGITVTFGDDCDSDTVRSVFGNIIDRNYVVDLTTTDGETICAELQTMVIAGEFGFVYRRFEDHAAVEGPASVVPFSEITGIRIH